MALLSADKPARAFIGHVEPTFDWPLQDPETGQPLRAAFCRALYRKMYSKQRFPVALAFYDLHLEAAKLFQKWYQAKEGAAMAEDAETREVKRETALRLQLGGLDREGVVILGDPAAVLPPTERQAQNI